LRLGSPLCREPCLWHGWG